MTSLFEAAQKLVKQNHLARCSNQALSCTGIIATTPVCLCTLKQKRMIAALLELGNDI